MNTNTNNKLCLDIVFNNKSERVDIGNPLGTIIPFSHNLESIQQIFSNDENSSIGLILIKKSPLLFNEKKVGMNSLKVNKLFEEEMGRQREANNASFGEKGASGSWVFVKSVPLINNYNSVEGTIFFKIKFVEVEIEIGPEYDCDGERMLNYDYSNGPGNFGGYNGDFSRSSNRSMFNLGDTSENGTSRIANTFSKIINVKDGASKPKNKNFNGDCSGNFCLSNEELRVNGSLPDGDQLLSKEIGIDRSKNLSYNTPSPGSNLMTIFPSKKTPKLLKKKSVITKKINNTVINQHSTYNTNQTVTFSRTKIQETADSNTANSKKYVFNEPPPSQDLPKKKKLIHTRKMSLEGGPSSGNFSEMEETSKIEAWIESLMTELNKEKNRIEQQETDILKIKEMQDKRIEKLDEQKKEFNEQLELVSKKENETLSEKEHITKIWKDLTDYQISVQDGIKESQDQLDQKEQSQCIDEMRTVYLETKIQDLKNEIMEESQEINIMLTVNPKFSDKYYNNFDGDGDGSSSGEDELSYEDFLKKNNVKESERILGGFCEAINLNEGKKNKDVFLKYNDGLGYVFFFIYILGLTMRKFKRTPGLVQRILAMA